LSRPPGARDPIADVWIMQADAARTHAG